MSLGILTWIPWASAQDAGSVESIQRLKKLSIEELLQQEVTSASRRPEPLARVATAIDVISGEEIRRSGVTTIPDALRLATGVHVARATGNSWAITARGLNASSSTANKMQVLRDGRTLYSPLFSGVFWDVQNYPIEDIERIEVIRGPGATMWGANAFNGVINIITRSAAETQGTLVTGGGGTEDQGFGGMRHGGKVKDTYYRAYVNFFNRDGLLLPNGQDAPDGMMLGQTGFRTDSELNELNRLTVQGDYYNGVLGTERRRDSRVGGGNILSRWTRVFGEESSLETQIYFDKTHRSLPSFEEDRDTFDFDAHHRFPLGERHDWMWGFNYRLSSDEIGNPRAPALAFVPSERNLQLFSAFVQDEITLIEDSLGVTAGSKFEHNDFSGFEVQPSARLAFTPRTNQTLWAGVSRAVRTPTRLDVDLLVRAPSAGGGTVMITNQAPDAFRSEEVIAFELGYRVQPHRRLSFDLAAFYNLYDNLRSIEPITPPGAVDRVLVLRNETEGDAYGFELAQQAELFEWWTLRASYTYLNTRLELSPNSRAREIAAPGPGQGTASEGNDPRHVFTIHSSLDLPGNIEFDQILRYVDALPNPFVPEYLALDLRLAWRPSANLELAVVGQNLLDDKHPEFTARQVQRGVYGKLTWRF